MRQIAERAGVNRSTVSLALRNDPRLKLETRQKIQSLAAEMGYRQNPLVSQLITQLRAGQQKHFQSNLAVLNFGLTNTIDAKIWEGIKQRATRLGYGLEVFHVQDTSPQRLEQILVNRGIRGVLLISLAHTRRLSDEFGSIWKNFACCCVGLHPFNPGLHFTGDDNYFTALTAVEKLAELGFTRIGLAMESGINTETEYRFVGGYLAAHQANPKLEQLPVLLLGKTDKAGFLTWFRKVQPWVVVCIQEEVLGWLVEAGYQVPQEVSVAILDLDATTSGSWAGMRQDRKSRGAFAVDVVVSQINHNEMGPPSAEIAMMTESVWQFGDTLQVPQKSEPAKPASAPRKRGKGNKP